MGDISYQALSTALDRINTGWIVTEPSLCKAKQDWQTVIHVNGLVCTERMLVKVWVVAEQSILELYIPAA